MANGAVELGIAFPPVITAALLVTIYGAGVIQEILALAIFFIPGFIRLSQQAASTILAQDYITAAPCRSEYAANPLSACFTRYGARASGAIFC